ncbi:DMT family transporter [Streptomyces fractus]|uniref:DMT family transporter n=1 Tax=Streptomyces fractus TaxID=641806 RepID=UPI003CEF720B
MRSGVTGPVATGGAVLLVGLSWAMESFLGRVSISRGYGTFDFPLALNFATVAVCGAACLGPAVRARALEGLKARWSTLVLTALALIFVPYLVLYLALGTITPAETSLISSMTPLFSLLVGAAWFHTRIRAATAACVALGFGGVSILIVPQVSDPARGAQTLWYLIMLVVPLSYAVSGFFIRRAARLGSGSLQLLLATNLVSLALFAVLNRGVRLPPSARAGDLVLFAAGVVFNVLAVIAVMRLSRILSPLVLSFSNYATVLFAFLLTALCLHAGLGARPVAAAALVVAGSLLVGRTQQTASPAPHRPS